MYLFKTFKQTIEVYLFVYTLHIVTIDRCDACGLLASQDLVWRAGVRLHLLDTAMFKFCSLNSDDVFCILLSDVINNEDVIRESLKKIQIYLNSLLNRPAVQTITNNINENTVQKTRLNIFNFLLFITYVITYVNV